MNMSTYVHMHMSVYGYVRGVCIYCIYLIDMTDLYRYDLDIA